MFIFKNQARVNGGSDNGIINKFINAEHSSHFKNKKKGNFKSRLNDKGIEQQVIIVNG